MVNFVLFKFLKKTMSTIPDSFSNDTTCYNNNSLQELCGDIEYNVSTINSSEKTLHANLKLVGTEKDNVGLRNRISSLQNNSNRHASETIKHINRLKREVPKEDKRFGIQVERLERTFVQALKDYAALQQEILEKQRKHPLVVLNTENPSLCDAGNVYFDNHGERRQSQIMLDFELENERRVKMEQEVAEVLSGVIDIHAIMIDLGKIVEDGGQKIVEIEVNVQATVDHTKDAVEVLGQVLQDTEQHRKRCFFGVIIISAVVIIILSVVLYYLFVK